jgi:hypothetical protein
MGDPKRQEGPHQKGDQSPLHRWKILVESRVFEPGPGRKEGIRYTSRIKRVRYCESKRHLHGH